MAGNGFSAACSDMHFRQNYFVRPFYLTHVIKIASVIHMALALSVAQCRHSSGEIGEFSP
jgi:hypothetical protein